MIKIIALAIICVFTLNKTSEAKPKSITQNGTASFYAQYFNGRTMANGSAFNVHSNNAASRTLPLGTIAKVTNKSNGRSAIVKICDRGPYASNRIIDLSPSTAKNLGFKNEGLASVIVQANYIKTKYVYAVNSHRTHHKRHA